MKRLLFFISFLVLTQYTQAQSRWTDHFNYTEVKQIIPIQDKLYCVSSNALFTYDLSTAEVEKISKVNLLNGVKPTSAAYNSDLDYLLIGYENGELDILGEKSENFIEIPLDDYTGSKKINHLSTAGNIMLISAAYGVSIFDLERREFAETTFFRTGGNYTAVNESEIFDGYIYAASKTGVKFHPIDEFIPNYNNWQSASGLPKQEFQHVQRFNDILLASSGGSLYALQNGQWQLKHIFAPIADLNVVDQTLIVSTQHQVHILNESLQITSQQTVSDIILSATYINGTIYAGTQNEGLINTQTKEKIYPDGPFSNEAYAVNAQDEYIWISPGGQQNFNQPNFNRNGFFYFDGKAWQHYQNESMNNATDIIHISYNPQNTHQFAVSTWGDDWGLFEFEEEKLKNIYFDIFKNQHGTKNGVVRLGGSTYDDQGNLYVTQTHISPTEEGHSAIHKKTPQGQWSSIKFNPPYSNGAGIKNPIVDRSGYIWAAQTRGDGVVVTNMSTFYRITTGEQSGDLPSNNVYAVEVDKNGTAWIGTQQGLRVKRNPIRALEAGNYTTDPVIIVQNGVPEALLTDTAINDITTDSSNRKWIATQGAGVFYISDSGTEIIHHFTADSYPLPSNNVNSIAVDTSTGIVYFATEAGLVSYKGDAVDTGDGFADVIAYPNPVRPGYEGPVTIKGLANRTEVKITDVVGNLIYKGKEAGGIVQWNQTNLKGQKVASGIYIVMLISGDGLETQTTKIAIVR
ncbi:MAG: two-component regulator propeller domain-containing protein [Weeksellaceae bacterium]